MSIDTSLAPRTTQDCQYAAKRGLPIEELPKIRDKEIAKYVRLRINMNTLLASAIETREEVAVERLLFLGANPNSVEKESEFECFTPLMVMATQKNKVQREAKDKHTQETLKAQQLAITTLLLNYNGDPNTMDNQGRPCIYKPIANGNIELTRLLLVRGAKPEQEGVPLIKTAIRKNDRAMMELLLQHDSSLRPSELKDYECDGKGNLLHFSAKSSSLEGLQLFLEMGVDPRLPDKHGRTPLHYAAKASFSEGVKLLLSHGVDPNLQDESKWAPIAYAAINANKETILQFLSVETLDLNVKNNDNNTPLTLAFRAHCSEQVLLKMIERGAICNGRPSSTLIGAFEYGASPSVVKAVLDRDGCEDIARLIHDLIPVFHSLCNLYPREDDLQRRKNFMDSFEHLVDMESFELFVQNKAYSDTAPITHAIMKGTHEITKRLVELNAHLNALDYCERNIVELIIRKDALNGCRENKELAEPWFDILRLIFAKTGLLHQRNSKGDTPLHIAVREKKSACVEFLLDQGADCNCPNQHGDTPFHLACEDYSMAVKFLQKGYSDLLVNYQNKSGDTPFHLLVRNHSISTVCYFSKLLEAGADPLIKNAKGESPWNYANAIPTRHPVLIKILRPWIPYWRRVCWWW